MLRSLVHQDLNRVAIFRSTLSWETVMVKKLLQSQPNCRSWPDLHLDNSTQGGYIEGSACPSSVVTALMCTQLLYL